jgi:hypothetical protein
MRVFLLDPFDYIRHDRHSCGCVELDAESFDAMLWLKSDSASFALQFVGPLYFWSKARKAFVFT